MPVPNPPRRRFGQHFLHDRSVIGRIVDRVEPADGVEVLEIGPGRGALTRPLLEKLPRLYAVEIDRDLAAELERAFPGGDRLIVFREDALKFDPCASVGRPLMIVGNLPYNISTPLLFHLAGFFHCIERMILMLQKEVADRLCAEHGSRDYGRLSVMIQSVCRPRRLFDVSPGAFTPPPKVESTVLELVPDESLAVAVKDRDGLARIVRAAFSRRRKTLRNALKSTLAEELIAAAGIDPACRPEQVSVEAYVRLANLAAGAGGPAPARTGRD